VRIGIVSWWFNRGQAIVSRRLRSALEESGHETFVLARRSKTLNPRDGVVDRSDVWDQRNITEGSAHDLTEDEYVSWASENRLEAVFFDQNIQFDEIAAIRRQGIYTIGRFVWEKFGPQESTAAKMAFDCIYSLTRCEQERYAQMGINSPYIPWGCYTESFTPQTLPPGDETVRFFYPGGHLTKRKPTLEMLHAFSRVTDSRARLIVKAQHAQRGAELAARFESTDSRIQLVVDDMPTNDHFALFASCDVCLAPSRWEGLGLHLFEAVEFGMPTITTDAPPMNEMVNHDVNGLLIPATSHSERQPGVPIWEPDGEAMTAAIEALCDDSLRARLADGARRCRAKRPWAATVSAYQSLLEQVTSGHPVYNQLDCHAHQ
jgi:1,2-diacylglycerol 3-alpha-glucosyltransferase